MTSPSLALPGRSWARRGWPLPAPPLSDVTVVAAQLGVSLLAPDTQELLGGWATVLGVRLSGDKSRRRKNIWLQLTRNGSNPTLLGKFIFM